MKEGGEKIYKFLYLYHLFINRIVKNALKKERKGS